MRYPRRLLGTLVILSILIFGCTSLNAPDPQPIISFAAIPTYPNAEFTQLEDISDADKVTRQTFETVDPPDKVLAFYKEHLKGFKWTAQKAGNDYIEYVDGTKCPWYSVDVWVQAQGEQTRVQIRFLEGGCL